MSDGAAVIPVILFAYARPAHLARVLACLRKNRVPLIYAYADGAKGEADYKAVIEVRALLRAVDWCEVRLVERAQNLGLGRNVLTGVDETAQKHEAFIVWEDDLVCVPGTYDWICAALRHYADDERVMSVSAWTHPRVTPRDAGGSPYFDARADCWVWGAWKRSWSGMTAESAVEKMNAAASLGMAPDAYGADLPAQAAIETTRNIWAVRWLYHHFKHGGLCLRPPWSMVEHIGFDATATNAQDASDWANLPLTAAPAVQTRWPDAVENSSCRSLWRAANPGRSPLKRLGKRVLKTLRGIRRKIVSKSMVALVRDWTGIGSYRGNYRTWDAARAASAGYDDERILIKAVEAARAVRDGRAAWERDTVLFYQPQCHKPLMNALRMAAAADGSLDVLDFGGALGSTWWQHRSWLAEFAKTRWSIVEQPAFVAAGRREFEIGPLRFYPTIEACLTEQRPSIVLLSSVLPYVENPHALLLELTRRDFTHIIIDRTGFSKTGRDRMTVQHVSADIYEASYPCWIFDRESLLAPLSREWRIVAEWPTFDGEGWQYEYRGLMLTRISRKDSAS